MHQKSINGHRLTMIV